MTVGDLDWMICNGGADIWQLLPEHDGKETTWVADEQWEGHISFRSAHLLHLLRPLRLPSCVKEYYSSLPSPKHVAEQRALKLSS